MIRHSRYRNRREAGSELAELLTDYGGTDTIVLGLPRGGVPVAAEVADRLALPLDVIVVRKLGVPFQPELGMGAIGEEGVRVLNEEIVAETRVTQDQIARVEDAQRAELTRRVERYRGGRPPLPLAGRTALLVDDGIATGSTMIAACQVVRARGAERVVVAVPVAPSHWQRRFAHVADQLICPWTPEPYYGVGQWYLDFAQTTDDEVEACLRAAHHATDGRPVGRLLPRDEEVEIPVDGVHLRGHLTVPDDAIGVVLFAHGSGSSRLSPRNRYVADALGHERLGTLLFDLLTPAEERDRSLVFDVDLLGRRLLEATRWLRDELAPARVPLAYFGASTGAAAALWASAEPGNPIAAVVSRGGRPDLAGPRLSRVTVPTLLIVGEWDTAVLRLNEEARRQLSGPSQLVVVPGATHLFEEPGTLRLAARAAGDWFEQHCGEPLSSRDL